MPISGGERLRAVLAQQKNPPQESKGVAIGFFASAKYPNGIPVASVAAANEFGTQASSTSPANIPPRPFMRPTIAQERKAIRDMLHQRADPKTFTVTHQDANAIGAYLAGRLQSQITSLREPPNSPRTIALKKSSNPLIDTGFMRMSVTWESLG